MRLLFRLAAAAVLSLLSLPALASTQPPRTSTVQQDAAAMCQSSCLATAASGPRGVTIQAAQACEMRCNAAQSYLAQQDSSGTAEATGRGRTGAVPMVPVATSVPAPVVARSFGAVYAGRSPSAAFGLVVGERDRLAAHQEAERQCAARGQGCRMLADVTSACAAAAQGVKRSQWALVMTSNPNTYGVTSISAGQGATQAQAEANALAECRSRDQGATCRIVVSACGERG